MRRSRRFPSRSSRATQITYGAAGTKPRRLTARITISTMDRLLLPVMLEDVSRLVYLDVDTMMLGDVCRAREDRPRRDARRGPRLQRQRGQRVATRRAKPAGRRSPPSCAAAWASATGTATPPSMPASS